MKIGIQGFLSEETVDPTTLARRLEALGFESFFLPEHPVIPVKTRIPYPGTADGKIPEPFCHMPDPLIGLTFAAAATRKIRLGTCIMLVPEHEPMVTAKQIATLDYYSGGRFIFGIGAGWLADECEILGVDFKRRWPMAREYLRAMKEIWTTREASFSGEFVKFPALLSYPKPVQKPHPPILIGAGGMGWKCERAVRDTVELGQGWMPVSLAATDLAHHVGEMKKLCAEKGRDFSSIEITVLHLPKSSLWHGKEPKRVVEEYRAAGAHRLILSPDSLELDCWESQVEALARGYLS